MLASAMYFVLFVAGLSIREGSATLVGNCNVSYFISNGQQCQREMMKNLHTKPNTTCSYEYGGEKTCLRRHIASCLAELPAYYVDPVTSLLVHQVYHCGDLTYDHSPTSAVILNLIKCKPQAFMDSEFCWRSFRDRLNANRSDPLLCREYAVAKECITEKAKANCEICEHVSRDTYNPFCPNNTDPVLHLNGCKDLASPLSCNARSIYKTAVHCEKTFLKGFLGHEKPDCGATYTALKACLDEQLSQTCEEYSNSQRLKGDIDKAVLAVLRGRRFFCESVNLRLIDLDFKIRPLVPCSREFFPAMEKCALPIREGYRTQNSTAGELCRNGSGDDVTFTPITFIPEIPENPDILNFQTAVKCSRVAQKSYCKFEKQVDYIIEESYTWVCTNYTEIETGGKNVSGSSCISARFCITIFGLVLQLLHGLF